MELTRVTQSKPVTLALSRVDHRTGFKNTVNIFFVYIYIYIYITNLVRKLDRRYHLSENKKGPFIC
jgi:hypothetical protein